MRCVIFRSTWIQIFILNERKRTVPQKDPLVTQHEKKPLSDTVIETTYIRAATSDNTRIAYQSDIAHFLKQGGTLPATAPSIETYLRQCAADYNPRTLKRRLTALRQWHKLKGLNDPTQSPAVIKTLRGIARLHGKPKKQALALRLQDLDQMVAALDQDKRLLTVRNKALLLLGYFGAFRRSELVALRWEQVHFVNDGLIIQLSHSKTDQAGEGEQCIIPLGNEVRCPVRALIEWREASGQWGGLIFRRVSKVEKLSDAAISACYWNRLLKQLVKAAGLPHAEYMSSHSLRRGFATEASRLGASMPAIQRHGRWRSTKIVLEYIEAGRQFSDSAVNVLFKF